MGRCTSCNVWDAVGYQTPKWLISFASKLSLTTEYVNSDRYCRPPHSSRIAAGTVRNEPLRSLLVWKLVSAIGRILRRSRIERTPLLVFPRLVLQRTCVRESITLTRTQNADPINILHDCLSLKNSSFILSLTIVRCYQIIL